MFGSAARSRRNVLSVLAGWLVPAVLCAQTPLGTEFQVNTYTTNTQYSPEVATDASGNFVVVWDSYSQDGSMMGAFAQRYASTGNPIGTELQVNTYTTNQQFSSTVASHADGSFVVAWASFTQDGEGMGIFGQRFDNAGNAVGSEFQINTYTTSNQNYPAVVIDASGNVIVLWRSDTQDGDAAGIFGQRFDSTGGPLGTEFQVNTYTTEYQQLPSVAVDASGNFVVAWASRTQDGSDWGIFGQRFDAAGNALGSEFQANTYTTNAQDMAAVASDPSGNFVVAWRSFGQDAPGSTGIFAQRFDSTGGIVGTEFQVNTYTSETQEHPAVSRDASGNFVVVWEGFGSGDDSRGVFGQLFDSAGTVIGSEFHVNTYTTVIQENPAVAMDPSGNFVVTWNSTEGQDGSLEGVFGQRFALTPPVPTPTSTPTVFGCPPTPRSSCRNAIKSVLKVRDKEDNAKDKWIWKWIKGQSTTIEEFSDPTTTSEYAFCVYDTNGSVLTAVIPPLFWSANDTGFKYKDPSKSILGMKKIKLKSSTTNAAKIVLIGGGDNLPDPTLFLSGTVTAQLTNSESGVCFTADYSGAEIITNTTEFLHAKTP